MGNTTSSSTRPMASYGELAEVIDNLPLLVREARRARGLSLRRVAEQTGLGFGTVARLERGDTVEITVVAPVLRWLDQTTYRPIIGKEMT